MTIQVSAGFEAGAIEVRSITDGRIELHIRKDATTDIACDFRQWFYFRVTGARGTPLSIDLCNAGACTYPSGWTDYRACASYDRIDWFRVPTRYAAGRLVIDHQPERDSVYYAYFEPYSSERHLALLGELEAAGGARIDVLGRSAEGRDIDRISIGEGPSPVWVIARQHPGETMAEWAVEGMLRRLVERDDPVAQALRSLATFHVVPNMNPDGAARGNLRANATGANLNREWMAPSLDRSPEVAVVRARMEQTGVACFFDLHGDEGLPYVFAAGSEMLPDFTDARRVEQNSFYEALRHASTDFQTQHGYGVGKYSADSLKLASKWVGHRFGCLSLTLELPFKDNANAPDARVGWSAARSARFGAALAEALHADRFGGAAR